MYQLLVLVHVLSAIIWVGGGLVQTVTIHRAGTSGGAAGALRAFEEQRWSFTRVSLPAFVLVLVSGISLVAISDVWRFSTPFVYIALALLVLAMFVPGANFEKKLIAMGERAGLDGAAAASVLRVGLRGSWIGMALLIVIDTLMVLKPGA